MHLIQTPFTPALARDVSKSQPRETEDEKVRPAYPKIDWEALVSQIKAGEETGMEQLYKLFNRGVRYYLSRQLGPLELEDKIHDTFLIVVNAIRRGDLREPERLMGFVRTVVRRQVAGYIEQAIQKRHDMTDLDAGFVVADRKQNPEQEAIVGQRAELIQNTLSVLSEKDREILTRFYLKEQPQEQICREMDLSETQFRLLKCRAKAKFGEIGRKSLGASGVLSALVRAQAG